MTATVQAQEPRVLDSLVEEADDFSWTASWQASDATSVSETQVEGGISRPPIPPLTPRRAIARTMLLVTGILSASMFLQQVIVSRVQHISSQNQAFDEFRNELATGALPVGPAGDDRRELAGGTPVAYLEIPAIELQEVVGEGTADGDLYRGPGHQRNTPLPGQVGVSVIQGRRFLYGGPFGHLDELKVDDEVRVTTGQGTFEFRVLGVRRAGDLVPEPPASGTSRLVLATADGWALMPDDVLRVDAELMGTAVGGPSVIGVTHPEERLLSGDTSTLWALAIWLQALIAVVLAAMWAWTRWGRAQAWVVFVPPIVLIGLAAAGEIARLLPNVS